MALRRLHPRFLAGEDDFLDADEHRRLAAFLRSVPTVPSGGRPSPSSFAFAAPTVESTVVSGRAEAAAGCPVWTADGPGSGAALPLPLAELAGRVSDHLAGEHDLWRAAGTPARRFTSVYVDRYLAGGSFVPHVDRDCYGPVVAGVSVGPGSCLLSFRSGGRTAVGHVLHPGSLYVFSADLRRPPFTHAISSVTDLRFGVTFRFTAAGPDATAG